MMTRRSFLKLLGVTSITLTTGGLASIRLKEPSVKAPMISFFDDIMTGHEQTQVACFKLFTEGMIYGPPGMGKTHTIKPIFGNHVLILGG